MTAAATPGASGGASTSSTASVASAVTSSSARSRTTSSGTSTTKKPAAWIFGDRRVDIGVFAGSALVSMLALVIGHFAGVLHGETPGWAWIAGVLFVDVAHVWSTAFRTYFDPKEFWRRPWLYVLVPLGCFLAAIEAYRVSEFFFWRALAYMAILHFVRQQYGWVMLYRARARETDELSRRLDIAAVYAGTLGPLAYWHAHMPRPFDWFEPGDIIAIPSWLGTLAMYASVTAFVGWAINSCRLHLKGRGNPGKSLVICTTALTWTVGIVVFDSDYAFTMCNVFAHGIPYVALVFLYQNKVVKARKQAPNPLLRNIVLFVGVLWMFAYVEEFLWDRSVYHERPWLFGAGWDPDSARGYILPLLVMPQLIHYVLDGFIWRRKTNPGVAEMWK